MYKIGVLGAGTWGMALARLLHNNGHCVTVWSAIGREVEEFSQTRKHPNLPGMEIPQEIAFTGEIARVCQGQDMLLFAVPSPYVRSTARLAAPFVGDNQIIVDVAKGIEADTLLTMTGIIAQEIANPTVKLVALSGPTHAEEVAKDLPTTIVSACEDKEVAELVQNVFWGSCMRVYTNEDVLGVELCGAVKNIIALVAGVAAGLGYGDNAKAALITRGMVEITRLGTAMGCKEQTFGGLAGIGDLIVTATSIHSRNNRCGLLIGQGASVEDAVRQVGMVVEGINALPAARALAKRYNVEMPIVEAAYQVVCEKTPLAEVVQNLMCRDKKPELPGSVWENHYE